MNARAIYSSFVLALSLVFLGLGHSQAATFYPVNVKYQQVMNKIVDETALRGWPTGGFENYGRHIDEIVASRENNIIAFTVKLDNYIDKRLYVLGNGNQLIDCTPYLNAAGVNPNNVYGLKMSRDGLRIFFFGSYGTDIYYLVPWFIWEVRPAFKGMAGGDGRVKYTVDHDGSRLFFKHVTTLGGISTPGLYYADVGDAKFTPRLMMNMNKLPGTQNTNLLRYLGSSQEGGQLLLTWYSSTQGSTAMWRVPTALNPPNPSQDPIKVPNEGHTGVWESQDLHNRIVDSGLGMPEGMASALYAYRDSGQAEQLWYVDLNSGEKKRLISGDGGGFSFPTLFDDGAFTRIVRFSGPFRKATRFNLMTYTDIQRDTHSYWFGESNTPHFLTDLTNNATTYYMASKPVDKTARIHRIDMLRGPGVNEWAPSITEVKYDKPWNWALGDIIPLTLTAKVIDPKGPTNIDYVKMQVLVDGLEMPAWLTNGYKPITESQMSDSGGGVFTCTSNLNMLSVFYTRYPLPRAVDIRIIAKNKDDHYTIFDTTISMTSGATACSGDVVVFQDITFVSGNIYNCTATTSITAGIGVIVQSGATVNFRAPKINLQPGFLVESGAVFSAKQ